jgi:glycogen debranching enzyme
VAETLAQQFEPKFWLEDEGYFTDTWSAGEPDKQLRPNQLWALTLPGVPLKPAAKKSALNAIRKELLTPVGLRTLSPRDPAYQARYQGDQPSRDRAYHQGTAWPWLLGLYAEAVVHIEGEESARRELEPVLGRLQTHFRTEACIGQISEVFDGDAPHRCGGAPAQAWSVAELFRAARLLVSP